MKDFIHVLPRGLFFYQNEFYDAVFGDKTDYPESLKDFLFTRTGDIEAAGEFYGAIEKWPQSVYCTLVEKCNVENRPIPEYENDRALPLDYHKELLASLKDYFGCGESNYRTPGDLIAARSYDSYLSGISLKFNPQDVIAAVEHATETVQAELVPYLSDSFGPDRYLPCGCHVAVQMNNSIENAAQSIKELRDAGVDLDALPNLSCDECSQLAAKVIPYAENKAQSAPDRTLGHKHEVNRDVAQRRQTERTTLNCYWWNEETNSFDVEDGIEEAVRNWGSFHSGTYSSPTGIRKDAIPMHKLELILDERRIIDDGLIRIDDVNNYLTKLIVETNGLRREGNFYIEENPEDGLGAITHIALCLSKQNWFRNYVKVLKCYRWNADTQDFDIEDAIQDMMLRVL